MIDIVVKTGIIDHAAFERLLISLLSDVAAEIDDKDRSSVHMEMSALARATCRTTESGDENSIRCHFELIDSVLSECCTGGRERCLCFVSGERFSWRREGRVSKGTEYTS